MTKFSHLFWLATALFISPVHAQQTAGVDWKKADAVSEGSISPRYYASAVSPSWVGKSSLITYNRTVGGKKEIFLFNPKDNKAKPLIKDIPSCGSMQP